MFYASFVLLGTFLSAIAQVLLKKEAMRDHKNIKSEYFNPFVLIAYGIFLIATLLSIYAYKGIPLSMGPVLESTSYLYITLFGAYFFNERITFRKIIALLCIIAGIIIYSCVG